MDVLRERVKSYFGRPPPASSSSSAAGAQGDTPRRHRSSSSPGRRAGHGANHSSSASDDRAGADGAADGLAYLDSSHSHVQHASPQLSPSEAGRPDHMVASSGGDDDAASFRFAPDETVRIRLLPYNPFFPIIEKDMTNGTTLTIGRYQRHLPADDPYNEGIYFRSTVVSRRHAILSFIDGEFFIKDVKSLGGTFVNSTRLSPPGKESKPVKVRHGNDIQFGVDYRPDARTGQVRNKDRCVEVRIEFPKLLKKKKIPRPPKWVPAEHHHTECCICLSALYQKQALFIAPCQHTFHYRCIAPLLRGKGFSCPMCRTNSDLHASLFSLDSAADMDCIDELSEPQSASAAINSLAHPVRVPSRSGVGAAVSPSDSAPPGSHSYDPSGGADGLSTPDRRHSLSASMENQVASRGASMPGSRSIENPGDSSDGDGDFDGNADGDFGPAETQGHNTARNSMLPNISPAELMLLGGRDDVGADLARLSLRAAAGDSHLPGIASMTEQQGPRTGTSDESFESRPATFYVAPSTDELATGGVSASSEVMMDASVQPFASSNAGDTIILSPSSGPALWSATTTAGGSIIDNQLHNNDGDIGAESDLTATVKMPDSPSQLRLFPGHQSPRAAANQPQSAGGVH